ncbi:MAG: hypothetical protein QXR84_09380 [Candidatus Bathyarchaeia archaeon]
MWSNFPHYRLKLTLIFNRPKIYLYLRRYLLNPWRTNISTVILKLSPNAPTVNAAPGIVVEGERPPSAKDHWKEGNSNSGQSDKLGEEK